MTTGATPDDIAKAMSKKKQGRKSEQKYLSFGPEETNVGHVRQNTIVFDGLTYTNVRKIAADVKKQLKKGSSYIQVRVVEDGTIEVYANERLS